MSDVRKGEDSRLLVYSFFAVAASVISFFFVFNSLILLNDRISGLATSTGTVNLTIESSAVVNFTTFEINWSSGRVNTGQSFAFLTSTGQTINGNWSTVNQGLVLQNIGTLNVTLDLAVGKTAASFIGGTNPGYFWNVTNVEGGSCVNGSVFQLNAWNTTNSTAPGTRFCNPLRFIDANDTIRIDINLTVPYDSLTGALTDTITATATAAS